MGSSDTRRVSRGIHSRSIRSVEHRVLMGRRTVYLGGGEDRQGESLVMNDEGAEYRVMPFRSTLFQVEDIVVPFSMLYHQSHHFDALPTRNW